jgi:hypothetical protein
MKIVRRLQLVYVFIPCETLVVQNRFCDLVELA